MGVIDQQYGRIVTAILVAVAFQIAGCSRPPTTPKTTVLASDPLEWEMQTHGNLPRLRVDSGGDRVFELLIDTGADVAVFTNELAAHWKLEPQHAGTIHFPHLHLAHVHSLHLQGVTWHDFKAAILPKDFLRYRGLDGLLGAALFRDCVMTVDYSQQRLRLHQRAPSVDARDLVPVRFLADGRLQLALDIAGKRHWALLDTGFSGSIIISRRLADRLRFHQPPKHTVPTLTMYALSEEFSIGRVDETVAIGRHRIEDPIVLIRAPQQALLSARADQGDLPGEEMIIGSALLRHFVVTIDQRERTVALARADDTPITTPPLYSLGFELHKEGDYLAVRDVAMESAAYHAGLRSWDRVLNINGRPADAVDPKFVQWLLEQSKPIRMRIQRAEQDLELWVPLLTVVP